MFGHIINTSKILKSTFNNIFSALFQSNIFSKNNQILTSSTKFSTIIERDEYVPSVEKLIEKMKRQPNGIRESLKESIHSRYS